MKNRRKQAYPKDQKGKPRNQVPYLDPAHQAEHWPKMEQGIGSIRAPKKNGNLSPYDRSLAEQRIANKARDHRRQVITEARQQATQLAGGATLIRPAFGRPLAFTLNVECSAGARVLAYDDDAA